MRTRSEAPWHVERRRHVQRPSWAAPWRTSQIPTQTDRAGPTRSRPRRPELPVDPANFTNGSHRILGDTDVQAALETIDGLPLSSGAPGTDGTDGTDGDDGMDGADGDDGHTPRVNSGTAFPTTPAPLSPDMFIFNDDVASGLVWLDTDGATALTAASNGDLARYNGTAWVKVINLTGPVSESYERVDSLVFTAVPRRRRR